jgi:hypothetical protein
MPTPDLPIDHFLPGDLVQVRGIEEIMETLDNTGCCERLPFMPEMQQYCGNAYKVLQRAEKTCVLDNPVRKLENMVVLEGLRCDGSSHDGCQLACMLFWKESECRPGGPIFEPESCSPAQDQCGGLCLPSHRTVSCVDQRRSLVGCWPIFPGHQIENVFISRARSAAVEAP